MAHDLTRFGEEEKAQERYKQAVRILKPLADSGIESSAFWLRDAEQYLKPPKEEQSGDR